MPNAAVTLPSEPERHHVVHFDAGNAWGFDGVVCHNLAGVKHTINAKPPGFVRRYAIRHFVRSIAIDIPLPPGWLIRRIVWHFGLVEIHAAAVAIPHRLITLAMFHKQSVQRDVVPVHGQTGDVFVKTQPTPRPWSARQSQKLSPTTSLPWMV